MTEPTPSASSIGHLPEGTWSFDEEVTRVFEDMLRRSVPDYAEMRRVVVEVGRLLIRPGTDIVDLGCSRGDGLSPFVDSQVRCVGVDVSAPMLAAARRRFARELESGLVELHELDVREGYPDVQASLTLLVLSLQFTPVEERGRILAAVRAHTVEGGGLILVEKVAGGSPWLDELLRELHERRKRDAGYTQEEVDRKRLSLAGVLLPLGAAENEQLLREAGFDDIECVWRSLNFAAWVGGIEEHPLRPMRASEVAARARRQVGHVLPRPVRSVAARALGAIGAPHWALPEWEHVPEGWAAARRARPRSGWDGEAVSSAYRTKRREVLEALSTTAPLAFPTSSLRPTAERSVRDHNTIMTFAYVLALAGRGHERLSVLDWGGGIGVHYRLGRALVPDLDLDYHVREIGEVCTVGRELEGEVTFSDDDLCLERAYDLVMASSSLQYEERWQATLARLATAASPYLFLTRVPVVFGAASHVVRHRALARGGETEFLSWVVNRDELVDCAEQAGARLEREFLITYSPPTLRAPERQEIRAFLFRCFPARQAGTV